MSLLYPFDKYELLEEVRDKNGDVIAEIQQDENGQIYVYVPYSGARAAVESYEDAQRHISKSEEWYLKYVYEGEVIRLINEGKEVTLYGDLWLTYCRLLDDGTLARLFPDKFSPA